MAVLRYAAQEAANIAQAEQRARQHGALNASLAQKKAAELYQPVDADLTDIAALEPVNDDFLQRKSDEWTNRTVAQVKTDLGINAKLEWVAVPASAVATGTAGQIAYESGQFYVCVAANTWQRTALAAW